jgi:L-ribulose-5-phosphate 4-epimerase
MILETLRAEVLDANLELVRRGLVLYTFGNASGIDRGRGLVAIKPSGVPYGVPYEDMNASDIAIVDMEGNTVEGTLRPSSDLATHLILYQAFPAIGGVAHTHSRAATVWAQAGCEIPCFGTTHADYFHEPVPVTPALSREEVESSYEANTGRAIVRRLAGKEVAQLVMQTLMVNSAANPISQHLLDKHFLRKHGRSASYGQVKNDG